MSAVGVQRVVPKTLRHMFVEHGYLNLTAHHPCAEGPCGCDLGFRIFALKRDAVRWAKTQGWRVQDVTPARNRWSDCFVVGQQIDGRTFRVIGENGPVDLAFLNPRGEESCRTCQDMSEAGMHPSHNGSKHCESGSVASGGANTHCSCDRCF